VNRFVVLKEDDIRKYFTEKGINDFVANIEYLAIMRGQDGKKPYNNCLVINIDEPYAGKVADMIEDEERRKGTWEHGEKTMREVMGLI